MKKMIKLVLASLTAAVFLAGCSDPPTDKVSEAKNLIESVIAAGGQEFAPEKVQSIKQRYDKALAEIDTENKAVFKNYTTAIFRLNQIMDECDELKARMAENKGEPVIKIAKRLKPVQTE